MGGDTDIWITPILHLSSLASTSGLGRLLGLLADESLRRVARRKLKGCTNAEITAELGCIEATVERRLQRIRGLWARETDA
jgi:DNA-directed RNA polymerase specialized sigma24 family protein